MILILSDGVSNKSIDDVIDWINYYQGECICINSNMILDKNTTISISGDNSFSFFMSKEGVPVPLDEINVIWNWRWFDYGLNDLKWTKNDIAIRGYINEELETLYSYFRYITSDKIWWGDKYVNKIKALSEAKRCGISIPATYITKSKKDLYLFYEKYRHVIIKPISNAIFFSKEQKKYAMYTAKITKKMINQMPDCFFPVLVQNEIKKDFEVRSFFLNNQFYSAAIISQNDLRTSIDFRNYNLPHPNRIVPYILPYEIENKLRSLLKNLDLETGSIDIIYADKKYYFLEINPVGQFDMISSPCNFQLSKQIAKFLITKDRDFHAYKKQ